MFTVYDRATGHIGAVREGQGNGDEYITDTTDVLPGRVPNTKYVDPLTGTLKPRVPVYIRFSRSEAPDGTAVSIIGVPEDATLVFRGQITADRTFTVQGRDIRVCLIGKYLAEAHCARLTEELLIERELRREARARVRQRNKEET